MSLEILKSKDKYNGGYLLILTLILASVFFIILGSFVSYIVTQSQVVNFRYEQTRATDIAESGLNYYKWYLAHYPNDLTDGNGAGATGPFVHTFADPEGGDIGEFALSIASTTYCGEITSIDITSVGHTYNNPEAKSIVHGRYARPTIASYSMVTNSGIYYASAGTVSGPVHSNQGIKMNKAHNSVISSGQTSWTCDSTYGCSPSQTVDGVYTTQPTVSNPALFAFPVPPIDFNAITVNLAAMQDKAENVSGAIYIPPSTKSGYHLNFNGNQLVVRKVNSKSNEPNGKAWGWYYNQMNGTSPYGTYTIDPSCPVVFVEDDVWLEGNITGKVTVAAADVDTPGKDPSIFLNGNITYNTQDTGLLAVAEKDVLIGFDVPENLILQGIFIAQTGYFGRYDYSDTAIPGGFAQHKLKDSLTLHGTVVSANRAGYNYGSPLRSGFINVISTYDTSQVYSPPPYTPKATDVYTFFNWRQDG
jgi:hypothetical protein